MSQNNQNSTRGGPSQQHAQTGMGNNKSQQQGDNTSASNRGGSSEQHAKAGSQSHKKID